MSTTIQNITHIGDQLLAGDRLSVDDALFLYENADLFTLGELANRLNQERNDRTVFYNINHHINPTNICVNQCRFCAYSKLAGDEGAYEQSLADILSEVSGAEKKGITEFHIVGGLHPTWPFSFYPTLLQTLRNEHPHITLKAFTAVEIDYFSQISKLPIKEVLLQLKDSGLEAMPGGGAEIFAPRVRNKICPEKISGKRWLEIMTVAHQLEIPTNATMLYGHIETIEDRLDHMGQLRQLQDQTGGFQVFIPLAFHATNTDIRKKGETSGIDDLKTLALARLFLDNFRHIKAYWVMLGEKIAQVALHFGVNDLDGTVVKERITHAAGAQSAKGHSEEYIRNLISRADRLPVERDTFYHPVDRTHSTMQACHD
ncbi:MAG: aminofutalosine synthase MqnE [Deltaproteobacteria bacterium]|nr:aminofutalosine synthase MqnE [Candidatus Anaeroferrophillus wilburensis]MBN2888694.1 aminofutalosine synthase MqnE [Deltaproteobacteria bacterium]